MGTGSFPGVKCGRSVELTPHPHLVPKVLEESRAIPLLPLWACVAYKKRENLPTFQDATTALTTDNTYVTAGGIE
jgi:hypothetical protein